MDPVEVAKDAAPGVAIALALKGPALRFLARLVGPATDEASAILRNEFSFLKELRQKILIKRLADAEKKLAELEIEPQPVRMKILHPILESGSLEEDEEIGVWWANLLVAAADPRSFVGVHPAMARILCELDRDDIRMLEAIYATLRADGIPTGTWTTRPIHLVRLRDSGTTQPPPMLRRRRIEENLRRLGVVSGSVGNDPENAHLYLTQLGLELIIACHPLGREELAKIESQNALWARLVYVETGTTWWLSSPSGEVSFHETGTFFQGGKVVRSGNFKVTDGSTIRFDGVHTLNTDRKLIHTYDFGGKMYSMKWIEVRVDESKSRIRAAEMIDESPRSMVSVELAIRSRP